MTPLEQWMMKMIQKSENRREIVVMIAKVQRIVLDQIYAGGYELMPENDLLDEAVDRMASDRSAIELDQKLSRYHGHRGRVIDYFLRSVRLLIEGSINYSLMNLCDSATRLVIVCNKMNRQLEMDDEGFAIVMNMLKDAV